MSGAVDVGRLPAAVWERMPQDLIFLGYRGSEAHGLKLPPADPHSTDDIDLIGVYVAEPEHYLGFGRKDTVEFWEGEYDVVLYEVRKFFHLLVKQNPNVLGTLWLPAHLGMAWPEWSALVERRALFASREAHASFAGYATSQLHRMTRQTERTPEIERETRLIEEEITAREKAIIPQQMSRHKKYESWSLQKLRTRRNDLKGQSGYMGEKRRHLVERYGYDTKNAAHLIRLLHMGREFLEDGEMRVDRTGIDRDTLLEIKRGGWPLEWVEKAAEKGFAEAKSARDGSPLPDRPDRAGAERLLLEILRNRIG